MILRWFSSRKVRQASDLCRRVRKLVNAQRDLLAGPALEALASAIRDVRAALQSGESLETIGTRVAHLESAANKWLRPYPHSGMRENLDVVLVALAVALAIRTFFLQPMAIPTGSMQPTLYGITAQSLKDEANHDAAAAPARFFHKLVWGLSYYHIVAKTSGSLELIEPPKQVLPFVKKQRFKLGGVWHNIWFPPATLPARDGIPPEQLLFYHAGVQPNRVYQKGEDVIKLKVKSGDRLFADRFTYNFRRPARGEIVIFATDGIAALQQGTHYIKRLVGLGGDRIQMGDDRHLVINGQRLDASTRYFENVYSFHGPPRDSHYSGHVRALSDHAGGSAPLFPSESTVYTVPAKHYFVMGDNTMNSYDSRYWGSFPQEKVIGKCAFVFWPISPRFGWGVR